MEKKGIKLTTLIIILILLVCIEGFYIVKLKSKNNVNENVAEQTNDVLEDNKEETIENLLSSSNTNIQDTEENTQSDLTPERNEEIAIEENKETTNKSIPTSELVKTLGYDLNSMAEDILNSIESYSEQGYILKSTIGDVTADKLSKDEVKQNRESYKTKILELLNNTEIVTKITIENATVICNYNFEKILNSLQIGSHMGIGIDTDEDGFKTYIFK